jgi:hypothetical protein
MSTNVQMLTREVYIADQRECIGTRKVVAAQMIRAGKPSRRSSLKHGVHPVRPVMTGGYAAVSAESGWREA